MFLHFSIPGILDEFRQKSFQMRLQLFQFRRLSYLLLVFPCKGSMEASAARGNILLLVINMGTRNGEAKGINARWYFLFANNFHFIMQKRTHRHWFPHINTVSWYLIPLSWTWLNMHSLHSRQLLNVNCFSWDFTWESVPYHHMFYDFIMFNGYLHVSTPKTVSLLRILQVAISPPPLSPSVLSPTIALCHVPPSEVIFLSTPAKQPWTLTLWKYYFKLLWQPGSTFSLI